MSVVAITPAQAYRLGWHQCCSGWHTRAVDDVPDSVEAAGEEARYGWFCGWYDAYDAPLGTPPDPASAGFWD